MTPSPAIGSILLPQLPGTYAQVWEGGSTLSRNLSVLYPNGLHGTSCLELGSGSGVCGLTAAIYGANVVLTDLAEALPYLKYNLASNLLPAERAAALIYSWGSEVKPLHEACAALETDAKRGKQPSGFELILCADVVYFAHAVDPLLAALDALATRETTTVLLCLKGRPGTLASHQGFLLGMQANGFRLLRVPLDCAQRGVYLLKARRERPPPVSGGGGSASSTSPGKAPLSELSAPPGRRALLLSCTPPRPRRWRVRGSAAAQRAEDARHGCVPLDVDALLRELGGDC